LFEGIDKRHIISGGIMGKNPVAFVGRRRDSVNEASIDSTTLKIHRYGRGQKGTAN
jgi:hypothetical protein